MAAELSSLGKQEITGLITSSEAINEITQRSSSTDHVMTMHDQQTTDSPEYSDSLKYLYDNIEEYLNLVVPLYHATIMGDWETAKFIFDKRPDMVRTGLFLTLGTALHVAATIQETKLNLHFVKKLVDMMTNEELELKNDASNTAFWIACAFGNMEIAVIMLKKNHNLLNIRGGVGDFLPLCVSATTGQYNLVKYLYSLSEKMSNDHWTDDDRNFTFLQCVEREFFDVALQMVEDRPELALNKYEVLEVLARKPHAFNTVENKLITRIKESIFRFFPLKLQPATEEDTYALKLLKNIWGHATRTMDLVEIKDMLKGPSTYLDDGTKQYNSQILFIAAEMGNTRFIVELIRPYPDLISLKDGGEKSMVDGLTIFHIAVMHRHQGIFNLLCEIGKSGNDVFLSHEKGTNNNMLHLVGKTSKEMAAKTSGASLLMQRELLWFKEVEKKMTPYLRERKNSDGQTPYELFSKENEDLVSKGLKWTRDCMVVATLIVTVAFAVAFTVPGGYNQDHGLPLFIHNPTFLVFVISNAASLFSSSTSLLVFLSVLTSRHDQRDFMYSLPRKLMIGLLTLVISVAAMMVTFSASFFVLYRNELLWVPILISVFATVPVIVFAVLQFPLLVDMFRSMYDSHYLFKPHKHMLYNKKRKLH